MDRKKRGKRGKNRNGNVNPPPDIPETPSGTTRAPQQRNDRFRRGQSDLLPETTSRTPLDNLRRSESAYLERKDSTSSKRSARTKKVRYSDYVEISTCLARYGSCDATLIRGKIRVIAGGQLAFVACDRGTIHMDVVIEGELHRNRAMDGDQVYVEILPLPTSSATGAGADIQEDSATEPPPSKLDFHAQESAEVLIDTMLKNAKISSEIPKDEDAFDDGISDDNMDVDDDIEDQSESERELFQEEIFTWQEDPVQMQLWNPTVSVRKCDQAPLPKNVSGQQKGRVIHVIPARFGISRQASELNPADEHHIQEAPRRTIVGSLKKLPSDTTPPRYLLSPNNRSLPCFMTPFHTHSDCAMNQASPDQLYRAEYVHGSWSSGDKWPPCVNLKPMGQSLNVDDETEALLVEYGVNHGDFSPKVLKSVEDVVLSGRQRIERRISPLGITEDLGWSPTPSMYLGRRDYRNERIFTIDPTTAKDLDDAVHIKPLPDGRVEIGVHIAGKF
jgi:exoribonuclease R